MTKKKGNALLIYGGGLMPIANQYIRAQADKLQETGFFEKVFVGFYSFEAMVNPKFIEEWSPKLKEESEAAFGGFFGTCRDVWLTDENLRNKTIKNLRAKNITWIFVGGGDGSARNCAEIAEDYANVGIGIAFLMPCTVDGIEGSLSLGIKPAVRVCCRIIEELASTCLNTRNSFEYPGLIVKFQGRNRDDIMASTLLKIDTGEVNFDRIKPLIIPIPANYSWDIKKIEALVNLQSNSQRPVLILLSEGASIAETELLKLFNRKMRTFEIGHLTQMNGHVSISDEDEIFQMLEYAYKPMCSAIEDGEPFALSYHANHSVRIEGINYYLKLNPKEGQKPTMAAKQEAVLKKYLL